MQKFAYTLKDNRREQTDYEMYFDIIRKMGIEVLTVYRERDSRGKLHCHGIMSIPKHFYRKSLRMFQGIHLYLTPIRSQSQEDGWQEYCTKDQFKEKDKFSLLLTDAIRKNKRKTFNKSLDTSQDKKR